MQTTSQAPAFIRTYVPLLVSALVGWLASIGLNVSDEAQTALAVGIGGVAAAAYYAAVRWAEARWPAVGVLLGSAKTPDSYSTGDTVAADPEAPDYDLATQEDAEAGGDEADPDSDEFVSEDLPAYVPGTDPDGGEPGHDEALGEGRHVAVSED